MKGQQQHGAVLELEGLGIDVGTNKRVLCPRCKGGEKKEETFVIHKNDDNQMTGYCHRASCHLFLSTGSSSNFNTETKASFKARTYEGNKLPLSFIRRRALKKKYQLYENDFRDVYWNPFRREYYFNVRDKMGVSFGGVTKRTGDFTGSKSYTYFTRPTEGLAFPSTYATLPVYKEIVVVEDMISALRVSHITKCVAMLGCSLNHEQMTMLSGMTDRLILAFDPDAFVESIKIAKKYRHMFDELTTSYLTQDPKDYYNNAYLAKDLGVSV